MTVIAQLAYAPVIENNLMINSVAEDTEEALSVYQGQNDVGVMPVIVVPYEIEDVDDATLKSVAMSMCAMAEERDPNEPSRVLAGRPAWAEYLQLARAAMIGLQDSVDPVEPAAGEQPERSDSNMNEMTMSGRLLDVIDLLQKKQKLAIIESEADLNSDWIAEVKSYFRNLPRHMVEDIGLKRNEFCLHALMNYELTDEILNTPEPELGKFRFSYPEYNG